MANGKRTGQERAGKLSDFNWIFAINGIVALTLIAKRIQLINLIINKMHNSPITTWRKNWKIRNISSDDDWHIPNAETIWRLKVKHSAFGSRHSVSIQCNRNESASGAGRSTCGPGLTVSEWVSIYFNFHECIVHTSACTVRLRTSIVINFNWWKQHAMAKELPESRMAIVNTLSFVLIVTF